MDLSSFLIVEKNPDVEQLNWVLIRFQRLKINRNIMVFSLAQATFFFLWACDNWTRLGSINPIELILETLLDSIHSIDFSDASEMDSIGLIGPNPVSLFFRHGEQNLIECNVSSHTIARSFLFRMCKIIIYICISYSSFTVKLKKQNNLNFLTILLAYVYNLLKVIHIKLESQYWTRSILRQ